MRFFDNLVGTHLLRPTSFINIMVSDMFHWLSAPIETVNSVEPITCFADIEIMSAYVFETFAAWVNKYKSSASARAFVLLKSKRK